jgi:uncharacterized membrane protein YdbT with pleckstrin-like domain
MSYVDTNLLKDEIVIYRTLLHWKVFIIPVVFAVIVLAIFVLVAAKAGYEHLELLMLIPAVLFILNAYITRRSSEFAVTNRRVIMKAGVIQTRSLEILLNKVEALAVNQTLLGKMLNYGDIIITGSGGTKELYGGIQDPLAFRRAVQEATPV